jgi:hypothetical protein
VAASPPALSPEEFLRLGHKSIELAADYLYALPRQPVFRPALLEGFLASTGLDFTTFCNPHH